MRRNASAPTWATSPVSSPSCPRSSLRGAASIRTAPRPRGSALAVPVLELLRAAQHVVLVADPDTNLVAVRVLGDPRLVLRREDRDAHRPVAGVLDVVGPVRPGREADGVAGLQRPLALRRPKQRRAVEDDQ